MIQYDTMQYEIIQATSPRKFVKSPATVSPYSWTLPVPETTSQIGQLYIYIYIYIHTYIQYITMYIHSLYMHLKYTPAAFPQSRARPVRTAGILADYEFGK